MIEKASRAGRRLYESSGGNQVDGLPPAQHCLVVTLSRMLFILLDFLFCLVYWGLLCFWVTSMFCCYIMKRQKNKHLKFCGWLRMEQSNLFIWRGFFKDFRYVSRLDRQRKRLFEEASLSHGVIKHICVECFCCHCFLFSLELAGWKITFCNFVVRIVFCIACFFCLHWVWDRLLVPFISWLVCSHNMWMQVAPTLCLL